MSTNDSDNANKGNNGASIADPSTIVALVALVISVVALIGTTLQVLQQYFASAAGYSNCGEKVIGEWHKSKKRKFVWEELRFEVQFEAPVIFVCPPGNNKGPVKDAPVAHIDGSEESLQRTRTKLPSTDDQVLSPAKPMPAQKGLHTADNEQATWVVLLQELQRMERDSQEWQASQFKQNPPRHQFASFQSHTLCAAIQAKKRTWDTMPDGIKKPYATTTMCHLVEMAAMLGIYWQEFDRSRDKYRAEGNGYSLTGTHVADLGIVFTFQISGQRRFEDNRIVPVDDAKDFAFGQVPTIFRNTSDTRRLDFPTEEQKDFSILRLGSSNEFAETLASFGCNTNTSNVLRSETKKHGHLFPLAFELLGMLGQTLRLPNSCFRVVPNPTFYTWDKKYFSLRKLIREYKRKITDDDLVTIDSSQIDRLQLLVEGIDRKLRDQKKTNGEDSISLELLDALHDSLNQCDLYFKGSIRQQIVELVLREHIQEVLKMVNNQDGYRDADESSSRSDGGGGANDDDEHDRTQQRRRVRFNDLMNAAPEERQEKLMDIYFAVVLPNVVRQVVQALRRSRASTLQVPGHHPMHDSVSSIGSAVPSPSPSPSPTPAPADNVPQVQVQPDDGGPSRPGLFKHNSSVDERQATDVWCTLVFRMLCWLLLHDFHRKDLQKPKNELLGSRLPVYIA